MIKKGDVLSTESIWSNLKISKKRSILEMHCSVIKFHGDHVLITNVISLSIKTMFIFLAHNLIF